MKAPHKAIQWAIVTALFSVGFYGFLMICDEDPFYQMTELEFFSEKAIGCGIVAAAVLFGRYLYRKGLLPVMDVKEEDIK